MIVPPARERESGSTDMQFTRIIDGASSIAATRVSAVTPAFAAPYAPSPAKPRIAATEAVGTIEPPRSAMRAPPA